MAVQVKVAKLHHEQYQFEHQNHSMEQAHDGHLSSFIIKDFHQWSILGLDVLGIRRILRSTSSMYLSLGGYEATWDSIRNKRDAVLKTAIMDQKTSRQPLRMISNFF
jgi:hypothetical protein